MGIRLEDSEVRDGLDMFKEKVLAGLEIYGETVAKDFESYAKANRPWTDRTGEARRRLKGYTQKFAQGVRICIAHGVPYGIHLELSHSKKYAILEPTVRLKSNDAVKGINEILSNIKVR